MPGLTFEMCQSGKLSEEVETKFKEAIDFLEAKKVSGITGDCGFMFNFQPLVRTLTNESHDEWPERVKALAAPLTTALATAHTKGKLPEALALALSEFHLLLLRPSCVLALSRLDGQVACRVAAPAAALDARNQLLEPVGVAISSSRTSSSGMSIDSSSSTCPRTRAASASGAALGGRSAGRAWVVGSGD